MQKDAVLKMWQKRDLVGKPFLEFFGRETPEEDETSIIRDEALEASSAKRAEEKEGQPVPKQSNFNRAYLEEHSAITGKHGKHTNAHYVWAKLHYECCYRMGPVTCAYGATWGEKCVQILSQKLHQGGECFDTNAAGQQEARASVQPLEDGSVVALPVTLHYKEGMEGYIKSFTQCDANTLMVHAQASDYNAGRNRVVLVGPTAPRFFEEPERVACDVVVEVSPHSVLCNYNNAVLPNPYVHCLRSGCDDSRELLKCVGALFCKGASVSQARQGVPTNWDVDVPNDNDKRVCPGCFLVGDELPSIKAGRTCGLPAPEDDNRIFRPAITDARFQGTGFVPSGVSPDPIVPTSLAASVHTVSIGRVSRIRASRGTMGEARAGKCAWCATELADHEEHDIVCTEGGEAGVRACLAPGGCGLPQGGVVVRGAAAVRRCKVLGADPAGQVGPEVADPEIVFDARGDLAAASALVRDYAHKDTAPALAFVVRDAPELWGFMRCARNEFPGLSMVAVESDAAAISAAARLTTFPDCALYAGGAVPRITNAVPAPAPEDDHASARDHNVQIDCAQEGCGADEVQLNLRAIGANPKDVVAAMGMPSGRSLVFGVVCAGVVSALGEQAARQSGFKVGDAVLAACFTPDGAREYLMGTTAAAKWHSVVPAPKGVDLAAAAGVVLAMATAYQSLAKLAQLASGETVLIHSATRGVGQAAIQVAKRAGAKVIGSAGTPEKRKRLVEELGCDHAIDSRDHTCFVREVLACTEGRGCDVVLNSFRGAAKAESMGCLAPGGRFVEIGKVGMQQDSQGLLQQNISSFSFHLNLLGRTHPAKAQLILREVVQLLEKGELRPVETKVPPLSVVSGGLQRMSCGEHRQGKIVRRVEEGWAPERPSPSAAILHRDGSYLFTVEDAQRTVLSSGCAAEGSAHSAPPKLKQKLEQDWQAFLTWNGKTYTLNLSAQTSCAELQEIIFTKTNVLPEAQRLKYCGKPVHRGNPHGLVQPNGTVTMTVPLPGGGRGAEDRRVGQHSATAAARLQQVQRGLPVLLAGDFAGELSDAVRRTQAGDLTTQALARVFQRCRSAEDVPRPVVKSSDKRRMKVADWEQFVKNNKKSIVFHPETGVGLALTWQSGAPKTYIPDVVPLELPTFRVPAIQLDEWRGNKKRAEGKREDRGQEGGASSVSGSAAAVGAAQRCPVPPPPLLQAPPAAAAQRASASDSARDWGAADAQEDEEEWEEVEEAEEVEEVEEVEIGEDEEEYEEWAQHHQQQQQQHPAAPPPAAAAWRSSTPPSAAAAAQGSGLPCPHSPLSQRPAQGGPAPASPLPRAREEEDCLAAAQLRAERARSAEQSREISRLRTESQQRGRQLKEQREAFRSISRENDRLRARSVRQQQEVDAARAAEESERLARAAVERENRELEARASAAEAKAERQRKELERVRRQREELEREREQREQEQAQQREGIVQQRQPQQQYGGPASQQQQNQFDDGAAGGAAAWSAPQQQQNQFDDGAAGGAAAWSAPQEAAPEAPAGWTPLHYAAAQGRVPELQGMLGTANLDAQGPDGTTPLHLAARYGHSVCAAELLRAGAAATIRDNSHNLPADSAAHSGHHHLAANIHFHGQRAESHDLPFQGQGSADVGVPPAKRPRRDAAWPTQGGGAPTEAGKVLFRMRNNIQLGGPEHVYAATPGAVIDDLACRELANVFKVQSHQLVFVAAGLRTTHWPGEGTTVFVCAKRSAASTTTVSSGAKGMGHTQWGTAGAAGPAGWSGSMPQPGMQPWHHQPME